MINNTEEQNSACWGMAEIWNAALLEREERPVVARQKLWASELGKSPIDLFLKLKGTAYTNPPNARSLRKFEAGNVFEWIVSLVLKRAGILKSGQKWCEYQYRGLLPVSGKADFIAGGQIEYDKAVEFIKFLERAEIPDVFLRCFDRVIVYLKEKYPNGIDEMPLEVKSVSSFMADRLEVVKKPSADHRKQTFHYLKAMNYEKANIIYICRDDLRMNEFSVLNPSFVEDEYKKDIQTISDYFYADQRPPVENLIVFDEEYGKFSKNFKIEWSPYLTMLYGFKEPREYSEPYSRLVTSWNRVIKRKKEGKNMTDKNTLILKDIETAGFEVEKITEKFILQGEIEEE